MTTLINLSQRIGENVSTLKIILSNYSMDKLYETLPKNIVDHSKSKTYFFNLRTNQYSIWELNYQDITESRTLISLTNTDLRTLLINTIIEIIKMRTTPSNTYRCNNEFC